MYKILKTVVLATAMISGTGAYAMFAKMSDQQLIDNSQVIVVGTLTGFVKAPNSVSGESQIFGLVEVQETLKGQVGDTLLLVVPQPGAAVSSSDIFYQAADKGLWYLRQVNETGTLVFAADTPQRFVPMAEASSDIAVLRKSMQP